MKRGKDPHFSNTHAHISNCNVNTNKNLKLPQQGHFIVPKDMFSATTVRGKDILVDNVQHLSTMQRGQS